MGTTASQAATISGNRTTFHRHEDGTHSHTKADMALLSELSGDREAACVYRLFDRVVDLLDLGLLTLPQIRHVTKGAGFQIRRYLQGAKNAPSRWSGGGSWRWLMRLIWPETLPGYCVPKNRVALGLVDVYRDEAEMRVVRPEQLPSIVEAALQISDHRCRTAYLTDLDKDLAVPVERAVMLGPVEMANIKVARSLIADYLAENEIVVEPLDPETVNVARWRRSPNGNWALVVEVNDIPITLDHASDLLAAGTELRVQAYVLRRDEKLTTVSEPSDVVLTSDFFLDKDARGTKQRTNKAWGLLDE